MALTMTAAQFAEKHNRRTKAALQDLQAGVQAVTESPTAKAAAKQDKMLQRLTDAVTSGKWANGLKRVTLEEWKQRTISLGIPRISAGLDANKAKVEAFAADLIPFIQTAQTQLSRMPDTTLEDSIQRMAQWTRTMATFRRK